ncbi:polyribonucleotide nucleotidyltransferase [Acetoanaerobium noterae]|jgi:polyribonucleotide nucleotidyltransferase|uniref:Polyribonucleotide nucleotidyltransferase n=1 Tax=Acetoanaerobium noterae TaxID=745369 RepID=A0A1T4ZUC8_9FIRM|nr:polyribonucleotide nucleotidyltransferase [Acetoanaerobium noterae]MBP8762355.1 polyribonucleotide nucleotidyltransferase [Acetoanaerobium sp.]MBP9499362.1 polyribonucleotide nucleotidyltransferase [Acetoanaerobium sp.]SKB26340.1 polyribonucleotide nucleotidyltransferase [Acetoanaerobium noterae]
MSKIYETSIGGKNLSVEIGKVAELANGACILRSGDTVVLVIATNSEKPRDGIDFFPLSVDYEEKLYAAGKIPGGFIKREGRPSERSILTSRLIDRPIRPLFPKGYRNDVQVVATVLSMDQNANPDTMAMIGSSIALSISSIPFNGPTGSVSVGLIDGEFIINPDLDQRAKSQMYLVVSGTKEAIMMVEAGSNEISEDTMLKAILFAHEEIKKIVGFIEEIVNDIGKPKDEVVLFVPQEEILSAVSEYGKQKMKDAILTKDKQERLENMDKVKQDILEHFVDIYPENMKDVSEIIYKLTKDGVRELILKDKIRPDNRMHEEIRPIWSEASVLPRTHGSAIFTRGQTQVMSITTLGALGDVQILDGLSEEEEKRYMHHYNFPAYSVGEARPSRGPGRREIGHGALAERALEPMLPSKEDFPYAIRVVSEVLSSNGSTSQASVCGSTLSLLDAGVPLKDMVAGIAMGLIKEGDDVAILSDIQGMEDFLGDMDFKVAGTEKGITAIQMDIKIAGIDEEILTRALEQARVGRLHILNEMKKTLSAPREEISEYAPMIITMKIDPDKIRDVIGPGGKVINKIIEETGVKIDIENDGNVFIAAVARDMGKKARAMIENIVKVPEVGQKYMGKVTKLMAFGAFMEILPGKEGLLHVSQIDVKRVNKVEDVLSVGDEFEVLLTEIDAQGRMNLSRKALLKPEEPAKEE